jgi:hypothetical protein
MDFQDQYRPGRAMGAVFEPLSPLMTLTTLKALG